VTEIPRYGGAPVPTKLRTDKVAEAITPLATQIANDPELREHAKAVLDSAKTVLEKVQSNGPRSAATDKKVQDEVIKAAKEIRKGAERLNTQAIGGNGSSKKRKVAKAAVVGAAAVGAAVVAKKAMSRDEDEFEYTP
jgi:hypothetical protein